MGISRRSFLKFAVSAGIGSGIGVAASPMIWKTIDDVAIWTQNWSWIPTSPKGVEGHAFTTSLVCPSACGLKVQTLNGVPLTATGNPSHPLGGGLSALAAAEVQLLHSPARIKTPLLKEPGGFTPISWERAMEIMSTYLSSAKDKALCISGDNNSSSLSVLSSFFGQLGSKDVFTMPSDAQVSAYACSLMGIEGQPTYSFANSDYVLAVGANALESWGTFIANRRIFSEHNPHDSIGRDMLCYAGPVLNQTATVSRWLPIKPGTETALLLGLANQAILKGRRIDATDFADFSLLASRYTLAAVSQICQVEPQALIDLSRALLAANNPLVIAGTEMTQGGDVLPQIAAISLNMLLMADKISIYSTSDINHDEKWAFNVIPHSETKYSPDKIDYKNLKLSETRLAIERKDLVARLRQAKANGDVNLLVLHEANPVYALPSPEETISTFNNIPFIISFASFMDESAKMANLVLPTTFGLEKFDDIESPYGVGRVFYAVTKPLATAPEYVRPSMDVILEIAPSLGVSLPLSYESVVKATYENIINMPFAKEFPSWGEMQAGKTFTSSLGLNAFQSMINFGSKHLSKYADAKLAENALYLAPNFKIAFGTAQTAIPPFNVKTIRKNELRGDLMSVQINSATARKHRLSNNEVVNISAGKHSVQAFLEIFEGVADNTLALNMGLGHWAFDEFSQNKGANAADLCSVQTENGSGFSVWSNSQVYVSKA